MPLDVKSVARQHIELWSSCTRCRRTGALLTLAPAQVLSTRPQARCTGSCCCEGGRWTTSCSSLHARRPAATQRPTRLGATRLSSARTARCVHITPSAHHVTEPPVMFPHIVWRSYVQAMPAACPYVTVLSKMPVSNRPQHPVVLRFMVLSLQHNSGVYSVVTPELWPQHLNSVPGKCCLLRTGLSNHRTRAGHHLCRTRLRRN